MIVRPLILIVAAALLVGEEPATSHDETLLRDAGVPTDAAGLLDFFRKRTLSEAEQARIAQTVQKLGDQSFAVRQKASADLIGLGRLARPYLKPALQDSDPEVARRAERCLAQIESTAGTVLPLAAARLLGVRKPAGAIPVILNFLPLADDELLEAELLETLAAVGFSGGKADPALAAALNDSAPARRSAAALLLGQSGSAEQRTAVRKLLEDPQPRVRLQAAEGLVRGGDKEAVPVLIALLGEAPLPVAWPAEELLCRIAGDAAPHAWLRGGNDAERRSVQAAWTDWWRQHRDKIELARLDAERRLLGLTLVCACDGYNQGKGKVWEVGPDGKPRWEINNANYPVDAQWLPGNRVLIAEQSGRKVTERDLTGKVLWEYAVRDSLVACQRLSNGNTFLATYTQLLEITPDGTSVFSHSPNGTTIYAAQKLGAGRFAYLGSDGVLVELDSAGKQLNRLKLEPAPTGLVKFTALPGGRYLVGRTAKVVELDKTGKVIWECPFANANSVIRLANGNILACSYPGRSVAEIDRSGKMVWQMPLEGGPLRASRR
jgi:HEAT repeats/PQQ-like domain